MSELIGGFIIVMFSIGLLGAIFNIINITLRILFAIIKFIFQKIKKEGNEYIKNKI